MQAERCAGSGLKTTLRICVNIRDMSDLKTLETNMASAGFYPIHRRYYWTCVGKSPGQQRCVH
ncbi:Uncharacterised protein [Raoultella ornithinolytica]|nr:Uncharacterised protein [Raoultella ornithinolytica]